MANWIYGTNSAERLRGSNIDDVFYAKSGDDTLLGGIGNDTLNGEGGFDTADYSDLADAVTLGAFGVVAKGALGTDALQSIERVYGSRRDGDLIDLSQAISRDGVSVSGSAVDLSQGTVVVRGKGGGLPVAVDVANFEDVLGTIYRDTLIGNSDDNTLSGNGVMIRSMVSTARICCWVAMAMTH